MKQQGKYMTTSSLISSIFNLKIKTDYLLQQQIKIHK